MPDIPWMTLNLKCTFKPGARRGMLAELKTILERCALELEFMTGSLQETPDRPHEFLLIEIWRGTREHLMREGRPKADRKADIANSKPHVECAGLLLRSPVHESVHE